MFGGLAASDDDLLYVTGTDDNKLYVLDQSSGEILYHRSLEAAGSAPPTLFSIDQTTHIAVIATGGKFYNFKEKGATIYVFSHSQK